MASTVVRAFQLAQNGAESELKAMIDSGEVAPDAVRTDGMYQGFSLLHAAASKGHSALCRYLVEAGASLHATTPKGLTALRMAIDKGHDAAAAVLKEAAETPAAPPAMAPELNAVADELATSLSSLELIEEATEAQFDEFLTRAVDAGSLTEAAADALTDEVAGGKDAAERCAIMRRRMEEHTSAGSTGDTARAEKDTGSGTRAASAIAEGADHKAEIARLKEAQQAKREAQQQRQRAERQKREVERQERQRQKDPASTAAAEPTARAPAPSLAPAGGRTSLAQAEEGARRFASMGLAELYEARLPQASPASAPPAETFELFETVRGRRVNTLSGLALHRDVLSAPEQTLTLAYCRRLAALGDEGALVGRTYSAPRKWMRGKGRVTVQMGCCYNYARDKQGRPPGILKGERVCGLPPFLLDVIDRMVERHIFDESTRPDSCIINFYTEGDCIPPHIDHHDFTRPFVTLSLLSEQPILFGEKIDITGEGEFAAPFELPLPLGSVLVLDGNGADVAKHCVPAVGADRVSITFRRIDARKVQMNVFEGPDGRAGGAHDAAAKSARPPAEAALQQRSRAVKGRGATEEQQSLQRPQQNARGGGKKGGGGGLMDRVAAAMATADEVVEEEEEVEEEVEVVAMSLEQIIAERRKAQGGGGAGGGGGRGGRGGGDGGRNGASGGHTERSSAGGASDRFAGAKGGRGSNGGPSSARTQAAADHSRAAPAAEKTVYASWDPRSPDYVDPKADRARRAKGGGKGGGERAERGGTHDVRNDREAARRNTRDGKASLGGESRFAQQPAPRGGFQAPVRHDPSDEEDELPSLDALRRGAGRWGE